jgi:hypothetical protein
MPISFKAIRARAERRNGGAKVLKASAEDEPDPRQGHAGDLDDR